MTPKPDDHPAKWIYQEHTREKHNVLSYYLKVWASITSSSNQKLRVFDCFAGRGGYTGSDDTEPFPLTNIEVDIEYPGSPLIILDALAEHDHNFREVEAIFLEPNNANRGDLQEHLDQVSGELSNIDYSISDQTFQNGIEAEINDSGGWGGFALFFMDPFGIKDLDYDVVSEVTSSPRFDCIITLMTKELIRWQESGSHEESFKTLYGTEEWLSELQSYEANHLETEEAEYYCKRLEDGGTEYTLAYMTTRGDTKQLMYDLVMTTNNSRGLEAMKESVTRCGSEYALAYAPERSDIGGPEQATLGSSGIMTEAKRAKSYLLTRFAGKEMEFDELVRKVFEDPERLYAESLKKDYRQYLKELDNDGDIEVPSRVAEDDPLLGDYSIEFPENPEEK